MVHPLAAVQLLCSRRAFWIAWLLGAVALLVCVAVSTLLAWIAGRWIAPVHRGRLALAVGGGTTLCVVLVASITIFRPLTISHDVSSQVVPPEVQYWHLPTGSRIAYLAAPAGEPTERPPIVFLHGGPAGGIVTAKIVTEVMSSFARHGFDVYIYDQIGGGLSARLTDIEDFEIRQLRQRNKALLAGPGLAGQILQRCQTPNQRHCRIGTLSVSGAGNP